MLHSGDFLYDMRAVFMGDRSTWGNFASRLFFLFGLVLGGLVLFEKILDSLLDEIVLAFISISSFWLLAWQGQKPSSLLQ